MKQNNLRYTFVFIALIVGALSLAACSGGTPNGDSTPAATLPLEDCEISSPGASEATDARCGRLAVYEDPEAGSGKQIELFVAVIPAVSRTPQGGPLFLLAGGPGEAATEAFPQFLSVFERIHQKRDIVLFDQRGTGKSNPLKCPSTTENIEPDSDSFDIKKVEKELSTCLKSFDADPRLYTTSQAVSDLEQVRTALGYEKMNLMGVSYGTRVALAYLREYPEQLETVVLDGLNPIDWELGPHNPDNAQRAMDLILKRCEEDAACHKAFPDVQKEFTDMMAALEKAPVEVTLPHPVSGERETFNFTRQKAATTLMMISYSPENAALLPLMIHAAAGEGDYRGLAAQYLSSTDNLEKSISDGMYLSVICSEDVPYYPETNPESDSYLPVRLEYLKQECGLWPHTAVMEDLKKPVSSYVPVLLLSGQADPVTPPANAEQAAKTLTNSMQLVIPQMGHGQFYRGCLPRVITNFIQEGSLENLDTACVAVVKAPPFFLTLAGPQP
ncbi:MAG: alpha/beta hydrolase [Anaerolineaceae bacterium]